MTANTKDTMTAGEAITRMKRRVDYCRLQRDRQVSRGLDMNARAWDDRLRTYEWVVRELKSGEDPWWWCEDEYEKMSRESRDRKGE